MTRYQLPDLTYDYSALEPHLSGRIMQLHHDKHHRTYVEGANQAIERLLELRHRGDYAQLASVERELAFNVSGHVLHSLFWQNLAPRAGGSPTGVLSEAIDRDFGGFEPMKAQLVRTAASIQGSGWAALVWDPLLYRLGTTQLHDHQSQVTQGSYLLMVIDAWEHAYYLQYQTEKARYFDALWNLWNWDDIARRFELARTSDLGLQGAARDVEQLPPPIEARH